MALRNEQDEVTKERKISGQWLVVSGQWAAWILFSAGVGFALAGEYVVWPDVLGGGGGLYFTA